MTCRQRDDSIALASEKDIGIDEECTRPFSNEGREDRVEIGFSDRSRDKNLSPDRAGCLLYDCRIALCVRIGRIYQQRAIILVVGMICPNCFAGSGPAIMLTPVRLPLGGALGCPRGQLQPHRRRY